MLLQGLGEVVFTGGRIQRVEVVSGLQPGDQVVISDMSSFKNKNKLKVK